MATYGYKDDAELAFQIAIRIMTGEIIAYRDPVDKDVVHTIARSVAQRHMKVLQAMDVLDVLQGATISEVAEFCQWGSDIIEKARVWLASGNRIGGGR